MAVRMDSIGQRSPTEARKPSLEYESRSVAAGCGVVIGARTIGCWRLHMTESISVAEANIFPISNAVETNGSIMVRVSKYRVFIVVRLTVTVSALTGGTVRGDHFFDCGLRRYRRVGGN